MALLQIPQLTVEQVSKIGQNLPAAIPPEYLTSIVFFSFAFFILSLIKFNLKMRIIIALFLAVGLVGISFLPTVISSKISPYVSMISNITKSLGMQGTLIASGALVLFGLVVGRVTGKFLFKKVIKKAGEPTTGMEKKLKSLEQQRDHFISQLKGAKGDPAREMKVEKQINKVNEKINILKAKLGLPITA